MLWKAIQNFIKSLKSQSNQSLLVKEIKLAEDGYAQAVIQVVGKPVFFPQKINEIVQDDKLLTQFPPQQIKTLVALACNERSSIPAYKISATDYETNELIVKEISTGKFFSLSMSEIKQPCLLEGFSKEDVFKIGVMYNECSNRSDQHEIHIIKKPKLCLVKK